MPVADASPAAHATSPFFQTPSLTTNGYCPVPQRLITDIHDNVLAVGMYAFVARLYLVRRSPVPLSRADVLRYDPSLKSGAVKRAFDRLIDGGWLIEGPQAGRTKHQYTPTWGRVKGAPLPWRLDQPCYGRPRHISRLPLDRSLFDICMGKLTPHATISATITRYVTVPVLSLTDIGSYALTLANLPHETPSLRWLGLVRSGQALPLPAEERLLAFISQRPLTLDDDSRAQCDTELTASGTRRLGVLSLPSRIDASHQSQPLFFVPPGLIGSMIGPLIGSMIGQSAENGPTTIAPTTPEMRSDVRSRGITWESRETQESWDSSPNPLTQATTLCGGGDSFKAEKTDQGNELPDTEAAKLLWAINAYPTSIVELAGMPSEQVGRAIAYAKSEPGIASIAGWVVDALRRHRDEGWRIPKVRKQRGCIDVDEVMNGPYGDLFRRDGDLSDLAEQGTELVQPGDQTLAQVLACDLVQPGQHAPAQGSVQLPTGQDQADELKVADAQLEHMAVGNADCTTLTRLWNRMLATMQVQLSRQEFNSWIRPAVLLSVEQGMATISAPSARIKNGLEQRYAAPLRELLTSLLGSPVHRLMVVQLEADEANPCAGSSEDSAPGVQPDESLTLQVQSDTAETSAMKTEVLAPTKDLPAPAPDHRPEWISVEQWMALPAMLRAALIGSTVVEGAVQAISPHLDHVLTTRYAREVAALIAAAL